MKCKECDLQLDYVIDPSLPIGLFIKSKCPNDHICFVQYDGKDFVVLNKLEIAELRKGNKLTPVDKKKTGLTI